MNTLSILLYLGDVVSTLEILLSASLAAVSIVMLFFAICYVENLEKKHGTEKEENFVLRGLSSCFKVLIVTVFLLVLVPNKDTIYLIAASEVGEEVIESPITQRLATKIEKYLDNVLETKE